jgi:DNA-binding transcriptional MerR regulator
MIFGPENFGKETSRAMLMSELAARAEVPVATVKYYLREGLLPPGRVTGPRRAEYDEAHLRRLHLLWMLREVGCVPVAALRDIIAAVESERDIHDRLCRIADALTPALDVDRDRASNDLVDLTLAEVGWTALRPDAAARVRLAALIRLLNSSEWPLAIDTATLTYYARLAEELGRAEVGLIDSTKEGADTLEDMVTGEAVFGEIFALLRRMAHEHLHAIGVRPDSSG